MREVRYIYFRYTVNNIRKNAGEIKNNHYEVNKFLKRLGKKIIVDCDDWSSLVIVFKTNYCFVVLFSTVYHSVFFYNWLFVF